MPSSGGQCFCGVCVSTKTVAIVETCGSFRSVEPPGLAFIACPISQVAGRLSLRVQQLDIKCETKTKDNVFVDVSCSVQFHVIAEEVYNAYYRLTNTEQQITSYVFDVIRSSLPKLDLDGAFASKDDIAEDVRRELQENMVNYGYKIVDALITDLDPAHKVKASMNEINASKRLREAALFKADADKIRQVKAAEAEAEARYLSGRGVAKQRQAIVNGLKESIDGFSSDIPGSTPKDIMDLLLLTQYFDLLRDVGCNQIFLTHEPGAVRGLQDQINQSLGAFTGTVKA